MKQMDAIAQYLVTLHQLVGHDTARRIIDGEDYPKSECVLCQFERGLATRDEVIECLGV